MMSQGIYKIRKTLLVPVGLDAFLLLCLVLICVFYRGSAPEVAIFAVFFLLAGYLFLDLTFRRISIDEKGLSLRRLWGEKEVPWETITHVGGLVIHGKAYLLLTTVIGFFIISSAYSGFSSLSEEILSHMDAEKVEEDVRAQIKNVPEGKAQIALAWVATLILLGVIFLKIYSFI
jgi:hypothetical protein